MMRAWKSLVHALRYDRRIQTAWLMPVFAIFGLSAFTDQPHALTVLDASMCLYALALLFRLAVWPMNFGIMLTCAVIAYGALNGLPQPGSAWPTVGVQLAAWPVCFWLKRHWRRDWRASMLLAALEGLAPFARAERWFVGRPSLRDACLQHGADPELVGRASAMLLGALDERQFTELAARIGAEQQESAGE
jgi:hypothetical protein